MARRNQQQFFPFVPEYMEWNDWNCNLCMWYGAEAIPHSQDEMMWMETAKRIMQIPTFNAYPVPDPETYGKWQDWAREFTLILNGPSH